MPTVTYPPPLALKAEAELVVKKATETAKTAKTVAGRLIGSFANHLTSNPSSKISPTGGKKSRKQRKSRKFRKSRKQRKQRKIKY